MRVLTVAEIREANEQTWESLFGATVTPPADEEAELDRLLVYAWGLAERLKHIPGYLHLPTPDARYQLAFGHAILRRLEETGRL